MANGFQPFSLAQVTGQAQQSAANTLSLESAISGRQRESQRIGTAQQATAGGIYDVQRHVKFLLAGGFIDDASKLAQIAQGQVRSQLEGIESLISIVNSTAEGLAGLNDTDAQKEWDNQREGFIDIGFDEALIPTKVPRGKGSLELAKLNAGLEKARLALQQQELKGKSAQEIARIKRDTALIKKGTAEAKAAGEDGFQFETKDQRTISNEATKLFKHLKDPFTGDLALLDRTQGSKLLQVSTKASRIFVRERSKGNNNFTHASAVTEAAKLLGMNTTPLPTADDPETSEAGGPVQGGAPKIVDGFRQRNVSNPNYPIGELVWDEIERDWVEWPRDKDKQ